LSVSPEKASLHINLACARFSSFSRGKENDWNRRSPAGATPLPMRCMLHRHLTLGCWTSLMCKAWKSETFKYFNYYVIVTNKVLGDYTE